MFCSGRIKIVNAILDSDFETVFKILETKEIELLPTRNIGIDYDSNNSVSKNFVNFFLLMPRIIFMTME